MSLDKDRNIQVCLTRCKLKKILMRCNTVYFGAEGEEYPKSTCIKLQRDWPQYY